MKKENVIKTCYSCLRKITPLNFDCGKICNGKCCKGDEKTGMLLFPGEEKFVDPRITIRENEFGDKIAVCKGVCDRDKRPLSCRIYPLFPVIYRENGEEKIHVEVDVRASCPLKSGNYRFESNFIRYVKRVGKYLLLNDETECFYRELSEEQRMYSELAEKLTVQ